MVAFIDRNLIQNPISIKPFGTYVFSYNEGTGRWSAGHSTRPNDKLVFDLAAPLSVEDEKSTTTAVEVLTIANQAVDKFDVADLPDGLSKQDIKDAVMTKLTAMVAADSDILETLETLNVKVDGNGGVTIDAVATADGSQKVTGKIDVKIEVDRITGIVG